MGILQAVDGFVVLAVMATAYSEYRWNAKRVLIPVSEGKPHHHRPHAGQTGNPARPDGGQAATTRRRAPATLSFGSFSSDSLESPCNEGENDRYQ